MTIQIEAAGVVFRSRAMVGSDTLAMDPSSTDTVIPKAIAKIAQYREGNGNPSGAEEDDTGTLAGFVEAVLEFVCGVGWLIGLLLQ